MMDFGHLGRNDRKRQTPQKKYHCHYCGKVFLEKEVKYVYKRSSVQTSLGGFDEEGKMIKGKNRDAPQLVRCISCGRACRSVIGKKQDG